MNGNIQTFTPFKRNSLKENEGFDNLLEEDNLNLTYEDLPYDDMDFGLGKVIIDTIRSNNPIKLLTHSILQTYKACNNDFNYEETMKPRRELTIPSEGKGFFI